MVLRISVIGTGYLGITHAAAMAELGFEVLGLDIDPAKVRALNEGRLPLYEPGLADLLDRHVAGGPGSTARLRFTTSYEETARFADIHFICVDTPQRHDGHACDMSNVDSVVRTLGPLLHRPALVVGKSTVPVGSAAGLAVLLEDLADAEVELAWNPEFLREGFAVADTLRPDRIVVGVHGEQAEKLLREVYAVPLAEGVPMVVTDLATAELTKNAANAFLATKISFINAMAEICEAAGGDVVQLADALGHDDRIGRRFLQAGIGFGGGCLPKDIRAFAARADEIGAAQALAFLAHVDSINARRRTRMTELAREAVGGDFSGRRVAVLGATFKPGSDDIRDSPALDVADRIRRQGARVTVFDPKGMDNARAALPALDYAAGVTEAVTGAHVVLHLTEWPEFRELDPHRLGEVAGSRQILDGRNTLDADVWREAGWCFRAIGRPTR